MLEANLLRYAPGTGLEPVRSRCGSRLRANYRFGCNRMMTVQSKTLTGAALRKLRSSGRLMTNFEFDDRSFQGAHDPTGAVRTVQKCPARRRVAGHQHSDEAHFSSVRDVPPAGPAQKPVRRLTGFDVPDCRLRSRSASEQRSRLRCAAWHPEPLQRRTETTEPGHQRTSASRP